MKREALVVGINRYPYMTNLLQPAKDAEALARLLEDCGDFEVQRLPCNIGKREVNPKELLQKQELEEAIKRLFQPKGHIIANTALLYFAGHGLLKQEATVHLVWIPKRRKPVLVGDVKLRLSQILTEVASEKKWIIKCLEIAPDHVHVLVEYDPSTPINSIVKAFKGRSSRYLRLEFPHLLKLPTLWTHAYFYDTTGKVSSAIIEAYINDPHHYK